MPENWPSARELMTPRPITLSTDAPVSKALGLMRSEGIHEIPILRNGRLAGMITYDSIARRSNLTLSTKVEHLMVLPPLITASTRYPEIARELLSVGLRGAPVVGKKGELLGIVSRTDLIRVLPDLSEISQHRIEEVASPANVVLREDDPCAPLLNQVRMLEEHPIPVQDRTGRIVGAVGLADLGRLLWRRSVPGKRDAPVPTDISGVTVGAIMNSPPLTVPPGATAGDAARAMSRAKVSSAFVVDGERAVGVVAQSDLLGLAVGRGEVPPELSDVYVQIHGLRGSGDPDALAEIDQLVAKGLKRVAHHAHPTLLSIGVSPHAARSGDATVHARLQTDRGIYFATVTGWNFYASVTAVLDDISEQVQRDHESAEHRRKGQPGRRRPVDEAPADPEIERKIRAATSDSDADE